MNIGSSGAVSTLVPQPTAAGTGQSSGQNGAATKEVESWVSSAPAPTAASGASGASRVTATEADNRAPADAPKTPAIKAESWATTEEVESWSGDNGDNPEPDPADPRLDIKV